jgi:PhnB protein
MQLEPYIFFHGTCEEALNFYARCFDGTVSEVHRFKDMPPEHAPDPAWAEKIMHANFRAGEVRFMASDGRPGTPPHGEDEISLCISTPDEGEGRRLFDALADGGAVEMPFEKQFWGSWHGQLIDKFGIQWMVTTGG